MEALLLLSVILAGMALGSCSTMVYYRVQHGEKISGRWFGKRAFCPHCHTKLRTRDLLPLFNWLLNKGKCAFCKARINPVYFFIEFFITLSSVLLYLKFGLNDQYFLLLGLATCLVITAATDYSYRTMPDQVLITLVMLGTTYRAMMTGEVMGMVHSFAFAVLLALGWRDFYKHHRGKVIVNYNYLKILGIAGIWLNFVPLIWFAAGMLIITVIASVATQSRMFQQAGSPRSLKSLAMTKKELPLQLAIAPLFIGITAYSVEFEALTRSLFRAF